MLADWARKQWRKEEREKGRAEEREVWQAWLSRGGRLGMESKAEAEKDGRDFTKPRPAPPDDS